MSFVCESPACPSTRPNTKGIPVAMIGPGIKPVLTAVLTRAVTYNVRKRDEEGDLVPDVTQGHETVRELRLCPPCAGVEASVSVTDDALAGVLRDATFVRGPRAHGGKDHRSECKRFLDDCTLCQRYLTTARLLPLDRLATATEEPLKGTMKVSFASLVFASIRVRDKETSKRAALDVKAAYAHLAPWSKRTGINRL